MSKRPDFTETSNVRWIESEDEFKEVIARNPASLVIFVSDWCQSCHRLEEMARIWAKGEYDYVQFAFVDVDVLPQLSETQGICVMPTSKCFTYGTHKTTVTGSNPAEVTC
eukprot:GHVN01100951.1.p1 GENE.GHVN01100951.1~~GHVN01100951.1.p1  ORF type:complete len:110 (+),score=7.22 GHVN01100951.1:256-585(+)